jgi:hypothetical protein
MSDGDDLLENRLEEAARRLEADPTLPGWVLWYVTELTSRPERRAQQQEAQAAAKYDLHVQTQRVQVGDGWSYFTFASRTPDLTPEEVAAILSAYLTPNGGRVSGRAIRKAGDDGRYTAADEAKNEARKREAVRARDDGNTRKREAAHARDDGSVRWARRVVAAALALVGIATVVGISSVWWFPALENRDHRLPFESTTWKANSRNAGPAWPTRLRMADHLLSGGVLRGKTRAEVTSLLGPPDSSGTAEIGYYLGPERGWIRIDSELLSVRFGPDGRVTDCYIWRD